MVVSSDFAILLLITIPVNAQMCMVRVIGSLANLSDALVPGGLAGRLVEQQRECDIKVVCFRVDFATEQ